MAPPCMAQRLIGFPKWMVYRNTKHVTCNMTNMTNEFWVHWCPTLNGHVCPLR